MSVGCESVREQCCLTCLETTTTTTTVATTTDSCRDEWGTQTCQDVIGAEGAGTYVKTLNVGYNTLAVSETLAPNADIRPINSLT